jgi:4-diphosphocytidyl-2-C-methyl-D-erythritol kinase
MSRTIRRLTARRNLFIIPPMRILNQGKDFLRVEAPAKINLFLEVLGERPDGYHEIETVMQEVTLFDGISFTLDRSLSLKQSGIRCGPKRENLVLKSARLLQERSGTEKGARIELKKRIPVGAGLGGGSSDAAAAFMALNELWGLKYSRKELAELSLAIGSDIAFFFTGGTALCRGRGEKVRPLRCPAGLYYVLVCPPQEVSTALIYAKLKKGLTEKTKHATLIEKYLQQHNLQKIRAGVFNRLEETVLSQFSRLRTVHEKLGAMGDANALVTGSGSAMFLLCDGKKEAENLRKRMRPIEGSVFVVTNMERRA